MASSVNEKLFLHFYYIREGAYSIMVIEMDSARRVQILDETVCNSLIVLMLLGKP